MPNDAQPQQPQSSEQVQPLPQQPLRERWLTIQEACAEAGVTRRTIYNWLAAGKLQVRYTIGGGPRIAATSLWLTRSPRQTRRRGASTGE